VFAIDENKVAKVPLGTPRSNEDMEMERKDIPEILPEAFKESMSVYSLVA